MELKWRDKLTKGDEWMNIKLLEDKLTHCQENLNFIAGELLKYKKAENYPKSKFEVGDVIYTFTSDIYFERGYVLEKSWDIKDGHWHYYIRLDYSNLIKDKDSKSWFYTEEYLHKDIQDLKNWMKARIDMFVKI